MGDTWSRAFNQSIKAISAQSQHRSIGVVYNTVSGGCYKLIGAQVNALIALFLPAVVEG